MKDDQLILEMNNISKSFSGVKALVDVSISCKKGSVHALVGENGAGKSTLVKLIYGLIKPDDGSMTLSGNNYIPNEPRDARKNGVAMVFQHFSLFIRDNYFLRGSLSRHRVL